MRYVKQFGIILLISFLGEVLHALLPLPVPASIYGIVLLFLCFILCCTPPSCTVHSNSCGTARIIISSRNVAFL